MKNARTISLCGIMAALTAISAFIRFPMFDTSFTMQVAVVLASGLILGAKRGAIAQAAYVMLGLIGAPVFIKGGGLNYVFNAEFGYLLGFIAAAYVCGLIAERGPNTFGRAIISCAAGIICIYVVAIPYVTFLLMYMAAPMPITRVLSLYCLAFLPLDALKAVAASLLSVAIRKRLGSTLFS